ncbi:XkdW family protein [Paenibacillus sp. TAF58]
MNIPQAIIHLFPQANPMLDFIVQDDSDGEGPYIAQWNMQEPLPTEEELQAAWAALQPTPDQVLEQTKLQHIESLNLKCNAAILTGFTSSTLGAVHIYDFDYEAQTNLNGMLSAVTNGMAAEPIMWKASGVPQPHTFEQFKALYADGLVHKNANISKYWELKAEVTSAINTEEIASITW